MSITSSIIRLSKRIIREERRLAPNASRYVHRDSSLKARGTASAVGRQRGVRYKEEAIVVLYSDSLFIQ
jgi:hypothetical protein